MKRALGASRTGVALKVLAERHGWRLRSLYRDIEVLRASGYQIRSENGRYFLKDPGPGVAGAVSEDERLALFLAREQARGWRATTLGRALDTLWNRVSAAGGGQAALVPVESAPWDHGGQMERGGLRPAQQDRANHRATTRCELAGP